MLNRLFKIAVPLILLLALVLLTGVVSAAANSPANLADRCCDGSEQPQAPASNDNCADHSCGCHCGNALLLNNIPLPPPTPSETSDLKWRLVSVLPADYIQSIDYPPETLGYASFDKTIMAQQQALLLAVERLHCYLVYNAGTSR